MAPVQPNKKSRIETKYPVEYLVNNVLPKDTCIEFDCSSLCSSLKHEKNMAATFGSSFDPHQMKLLPHMWKATPDEQKQITSSDRFDRTYQLKPYIPTGTQEEDEDDNQFNYNSFRMNSSREKDPLRKYKKNNAALGQHILRVPFVWVDEDDYEYDYSTFSEEQQNIDIANAIASSPPMQSFYHEHLVANNLPNKAMIVPYHYIAKLKSLFPLININYYEYSQDFYLPPENEQTHKTKKENNTVFPRMKYDLVIDTCTDDELWNSSQPLINELFSIDIIIHVFKDYGTLGNILSTLSSLHWEKNPLYVDDDNRTTAMTTTTTTTGSTLKQPYWRRKLNYIPINNPLIIVSPLQHYASFNFPVLGGGEKEEILQEVAHQIVTTMKHLQTIFNGCKWFNGEPNIKIINFNVEYSKENILLPSGNEHLYLLPITPEQLINMINNGEIISKKGLLIKCENELKLHFNYYLDNNYLINDNNDMEIIYNNNSEYIVFYYESIGYDKALQYHQWLRETHPDSKQRCLLLKGGIRSLHWNMKYSCGRYTEKDMARVFEMSDMAGIATIW